MFTVVVTNRYDIVSAYITNIVIEEKPDDPNDRYKVIGIQYGINVPDRVGRNSYPLTNKTNIFDDLLLAQRECIRLVLRLK
jgi:hypothetical protein